MMQDNLRQVQMRRHNAGRNARRAELKAAAEKRRNHRNAELVMLAIDMAKRAAVGVDAATHAFRARLRPRDADAAGVSVIVVDHRDSMRKRGLQPIDLVAQTIAQHLFAKADREGFAFTPV